jgi:integrase/recombinase XerD
MQEIRQFKPSTVSRRFSVIARTHPHMLRRAYVTTMLDAGADLLEMRIAVRHADPRTTMRSGPQQPRPAPEYILAAYMASGT